MKFGFSGQYVSCIIFSVLLIVISFIDMEHMVIPDDLALIGIGTGLIYSVFSGRSVESLQGICFGFVFMYLLGASAKIAFKKEALGEGDIKLLVMFGANIGIMGSLYAIFIGSIMGALAGITMVLLKKKNMADHIPFAPYLALGAVVSILMGCLM